MNLIFIITCLAAVVISVDAYHKIELVPNGKPFPGLKKGTRDEVLPSAGPGKTEINQGRIVGGQYANAEQFPYHVGLLVGFGTNVYAFCGGTLIGNEWIITAAHCTTGGKTFEVRLGSINIETPLRVSWGYQNHIHPDFGKKNGDVALVKIQWVDYNVNMAPAALPALNGHHSLFVNDRVVATGWGAINNHGDRGDQLKYVIMTVMEPQNCANIYGPNAKEPAIMCTNTKGVGSTCSGDSGSPLVLENTRLLVGITAFGGGDCSGGLPAGFQRITFYLDWIKDISGISW